LKQIGSTEVPISGAKLAKDLGVSRQVIVQDIALIRAAGHDVLSTNRGYLLNQPLQVERLIKVKHKDDEIQEELFAIVDFGGRILNVIVEHKIYGRIEVGLDINSRKQALEFIADLDSGEATPLNHLTDSEHYHKISADSEEEMDQIENYLREKGFLVEN
ncbi:MAG: transcription repressor NadR, partial [Rhodoferax sp.]